MAPRGRSTRSSAAARNAASSKSSAKQSALTFNNSRITKPSSATSAKDKKAAADAEVKAAKLLHNVEEPVEVKDEIEDVKVEEEVEEKPATTSIPIRSQSEPEAAARKVSEAQIRKYWKAKEDERKTPRLHQDGMSLHEKILREFDMSYQYGPCIGISRTRRWTRAQNLGLNPPIEVLAVLLKEDSNRKDKKFERAHMDMLVNSRLGIVAQ